MGDSSEDLGNLEHTAQPQAAQQVGESFLSDSALLLGSSSALSSLLCSFVASTLLLGLSSFIAYPGRVGPSESG